MPGRTRSATPRKLSANMPIPITTSASAAIARTDGSVAASSPEMTSSDAASRRRARRRRPRSTRRRRRGRSACAAGSRRCRRRRRSTGAIGDERVDLAVGRAVGDLRAGAACGLEPELDDGRALDDRLVADDGDRLRGAERRERRAEGVEPVGDLLRQDGGVRAEPLAEQLREPVGLLDRLAARERGHGRGAALAEQRLGAVERVVPRERLELPRAGLLERLDDAVARVEMVVGEAALVAQPALVDLGMVAGEDRA